MFLDILEIVFDSFSDVVSALDVDLFSVGGVGISFWNLILGLLTCGLIFGFFLVPRAGSGLGSLSNINKSDLKKRDSANRNSYEYYSANRERNEAYNSRYNAEHGRRR